MNSLFEIAISNVLVAGMLAAVVFLISRVWRKPALIHCLWVIVLLKLVTPPMIPIPIGVSWLPMTPDSHSPQPDPPGLMTAHTSELADRLTTAHGGEMPGHIEPIGKNGIRRDLHDSNETSPSWNSNDPAVIGAEADDPGGFNSAANRSIDASTNGLSSAAGDDSEQPGEFVG